jgi:hypothetical protein
MSNPLIDIESGAQVSIDISHAAIHNKRGYVVCGVTASLAAAAAETISFTTPVHGEVHFRPTSYSSLANSMSIIMTEGAICTGGTDAIPRNCWRNGDDKSKVVVKTAATISVAGGAIIYRDSVGSGGTSNRSGGSSGAPDERILKPDTTYSITFTNSGTSAATVGTYTLFWYEDLY